jgi:hypothetical protein
VPKELQHFITVVTTVILLGGLYQVPIKVIIAEENNISPTNSTLPKGMILLMSMYKLDQGDWLLKCFSLMLGVNGRTMPVTVRVCHFVCFCLLLNSVNIQLHGQHLLEMVENSPKKPEIFILWFSKCRM